MWPEGTRRPPISVSKEALYFSLLHDPFRTVAADEGEMDSPVAWITSTLGWSSEFTCPPVSNFIL